MTRYRDTAKLGRMFILPMTASRYNQMPAIIFYQFDNITNLHCCLLSPWNVGNCFRGYKLSRNSMPTFRRHLAWSHILFRARRV